MGVLIDVNFFQLIYFVFKINPFSMEGEYKEGQDSGLMERFTTPRKEAKEDLTLRRFQSRFPTTTSTTSWGRKQFTSASILHPVGFVTNSNQINLNWRNCKMAILMQMMNE